MKLLIATKNKGKMGEMKEFFQADGLEILSLDGFSNVPNIEETGKTFEENALLKAKTCFEFFGISSVADDGGLEIDFLNGEPGVLSRRWPSFAEATEGRPSRKKTDQELINIALEKLRGIPKEKRTARLRTVVTFYDGKNTLSETASIEGYITERQEKECEPGYPFRAIFWVPEFDKLFQDLTHDEHKIINHRRRACLSLAKRIGDLK